MSSDIEELAREGIPGVSPAWPAGPYPCWPSVGSDGKVYKDGQYSFTMPAANPAHDYTSNLDQGGLQLSGTAMWVDHFRHDWSDCHSTFILGFTLDAAGIRAEIANGQFTVIGHTGQAIVLRFQRAAQQRSPGPRDSGAPVGEPHDLPADARLHTLVQWPAERLQLRLPATHTRAPGEIAPGHPGGLHPGRLHPEPWSQAVRLGSMAWRRGLLALR